MSSVFLDFRTSDLYFAAYLKAVGVPFHEAVRVKSKTYFVFENLENLRDLKNAYFSGEAKVSALTLTNEVRNLKRLCHMH
jgi:hypothetical protein